MSHTISRTIRAVSLASLVAVVAACTTTKAATQTTDSSSGAVLNVGDQQQRLETLLKVSGALAGASYNVNFVEFGSGPLVDAGFAAHRIDVGSMGDLPASLAVYCTVVWLLSVCVSYWISVPRYEIAMFPALIAVWDLLARRPQWRAAAVAVSAGLFAYGAGLYATGRWLG